jgi:hypothetical protein
MFALQLDADRDVAVFEQNIVNMMRTAVKTFDVDKLWAAGLAVDRILKPLQDMCIENSAGHHNRLCALELNSTDQVRESVQINVIVSSYIFAAQILCRGGEFASAT